MCLRAAPAALNVTPHRTPLTASAAATAFALSVLLAASPAAVAQVVGPPTQTELDDAIREGQRFARNVQGTTPVAPRNRSGVRQIEAARIDGVNQKQMTAEGNVLLSQDTTVLSADRLTYDKSTDTARATGIFGSTAPATSSPVRSSNSRLMLIPALSTSQLTFSVAARRVRRSVLKLTARRQPLFEART